MSIEDALFRALRTSAQAQLAKQTRRALDVDELTEYVLAELREVVAFGDYEMKLRVRLKPAIAELIKASERAHASAPRRVSKST